MKNRIIIAVLILAIYTAKTNAQSTKTCQNKKLAGTYLLIKDSNGAKPKNDSEITLTLEGENATIHAVMPDKNLTSNGKFYACANKITISFSDFDFGANNKKFMLTGNSLILPFTVLGTVKNGYSKWKKIDNNRKEQHKNKRADNNPSNKGGNNNNNNNGKNSGDNKSDSGKGTHDKDNKSNDNSNINKTDVSDNEINNPESPYVGDYIGTGWGWEVRFKQTSGEFVSQFTGANPDELPFKGDKIIMSLTVEHATTFKIHIDENGQVKGEGKITYNLLPNLCGVAILTEQVNSAVNLASELDFFYDLSSEIGKEAVKEFKWTFTALQEYLVRSMNMTKTAGEGILEEEVTNFFIDATKNHLGNFNQVSEICNCAAGSTGIAGGDQIGPKDLKELIKTSGVDVAKAIFIDKLKPTLGLVLSIPGITQIQYYYKGLQNGPETRKFKIKGYLENDQLYLQMDGNVYDGSKDLTIEYMVNYQKETPTFPTWSPFLDNPATMNKANSEITIYELQTSQVKKGYKDRITGEKKTVEIPERKSVRKKLKLPFPFATFRKAGTHRNNVSVWHEYEYNWEVLKSN